MAKSDTISFRLEDAEKQKLADLVGYYQTDGLKEFGIKLNQTNIIIMLINREHDRLFGNNEQTTRRNDNGKIDQSQSIKK